MAQFLSTELGFVKYIIPKIKSVAWIADRGDAFLGDSGTRVRNHRELFELSE